MYKCVQTSGIFWAGEFERDGNETKIYRIYRRIERMQRAENYHLAFSHDHNRACPWSVRIFSAISMKIPWNISPKIWSITTIWIQKCEKFTEISLKVRERKLIDCSWPKLETITTRHLRSDFDDDFHAFAELHANVKSFACLRLGSMGDGFPNLEHLQVVEWNKWVGEPLSNGKL